MKIVVGLGNPGAQYENTPHSVGFEAVDRLAAELGLNWEFKKAYNALWCRGALGGESVVLVKPQTFMNLSGEAVAPIVRYSNASAADLVVVQDDIDLAVGRLRVRQGGSCGGHNGVRNIIERVGTPAFARVKIGVGKDRANVIAHVLGKFDPTTRKTMDLVVAAAAEAAKAVVTQGVARAMNAFNGYSAPPPETP